MIAQDSRAEIGFGLHNSFGQTIKCPSLTTTVQDDLAGFEWMRAAGGGSRASDPCRVGSANNQQERITRPWKEYAAFSVRYCDSFREAFLRAQSRSIRARSTPRE